MAKCERCLWSDQCYTDKRECFGYTPENEDELLDELITEGLYEFRRAWAVYIKEHSE